MTSQLPVVPRLYQVSNAYSYSTTPIAVSSMPIQSHPPLLENRIFFGKIAGMMMIVSPVRQDKTRQDKTRQYFIWSLIQTYDPPSLTLTLTLTLTHPLPSPLPPIRMKGQSTSILFCLVLFKVRSYFLFVFVCFFLAVK